MLCRQLLFVTMRRNSRELPLSCYLCNDVSRETQLIPVSFEFNPSRMQTSSKSNVGIPMSPIVLLDNSPNEMKKITTVR